MPPDGRIEPTPAQLRLAFGIEVHEPPVVLEDVYGSKQHVERGLEVLRLDKIEVVVQLVCDIVCYKGDIAYDASKPDGTPRKLKSGERLRALGWRPSIGLREGLDDTYRAYLESGA